MATADAIAGTAAALRKTHPTAPALDVLDLVMRGAGSGLALSADLLHPREPLGQILAESFDNGMAPEDWFNWTGPKADPLARDALLAIWRAEVLARFAARYGVQIA